MTTAAHLNCLRRSEIKPNKTDMKILSCVLAVFLAFSGYAQKALSKDYSYSVSEPYKVFDAKHKFYFAEENEAMSVKFDGPDIMIQKFDSQKPAFKKDKLYEKFFPKNYEIEDLLKVGGSYYVFFSSWDGDKEKEQLFTQQIDFASGEFLGTPMLLFDVNGKVTRHKNEDPGKRNWQFGFALGGCKFEIVTSQNRNKVLIQYRKKPEVKSDVKSFDIIGLCALDGNMQKQSVQEVTMPYTERRMNNLDYKLDNKGDLYLLTKVFHDDSNKEKKRKDTVANYHIELFRIKSGGDKIDITKFDNRDKFMNGLWIFDTNKDYLVCGGYYSNGKGDLKGRTGSEWFGGGKISPTGESDGVVAFKIRNDGTIYDEYFHEIPLDILNAFEGKRTARRNARKEENGISAKIPYLMLKNIQVLDDGSMMLVGEQFYMEQQNNAAGINGSGFGPGPMRTTNFGFRNVQYDYHYGDILATKIAADGSLSFMNKIPKEQVGTKGLGGMSYKYFFANNTHYFVYLDNVKNIDLPEGKKPARHSDGQGGYLTCVKMSNPDGDLKKGSILNAREVEDFKIYQFATNRIVQTSENSFMVEAYKKQKEDIMIKVTLN